MDAWGSTIRDLADGRLGSTIRDLADGRLAALSATSQMDADTVTQGMEQTRMKGHAWQLTLF